jgi:hypothetical protein
MQPFEDIRREVERFAEKLIQWGVPPSHKLLRDLQDMELAAVRFVNQQRRNESIRELLPKLGIEKTVERCGVCRATVYNAVRKSKKIQ